MAVITSLLLWLPFLLLLPLLVLLKKKPKKNLPPGPPGLPLIGNLHQVGRIPDHEYLWQLSKKYGPVVRLQLGRVPYVVFQSAEAAKEILKTYDIHACSRPMFNGARMLTYNYQDLAFAPYSDYWKEIRKLCVMELFSVKRVQSNWLIREEELTRMINSISESSGAPVDLGSHLYALVASIIFRVACGTSLQDTAYKNGKDVLRLLQIIDVVIGGRSWGEFFPSWIGWIIDRISGVPKKYDAIFNELDGFFQQLIGDHLKPGRKQEHEDIIDVLLKLASDQTGVAAGPELGGHDSIKAVILDIVLGGIDATSVNMTTVMTTLAGNPSMMKKVQDEVRKCVGNKGKVTESDTDQLHYLKLIIKETLRLHPPVPLMITKETISHVKIQGYDIEPKTQYHVNIWACARDPKFWKDPEKFIPDRFEGISTDFKGQDFGFLPFGSGRRICPGIFMANTTVDLVLANLLYHFDWKLPAGMKEEDFTVAKRVNLTLVPVKFNMN